MPASAIHQSVVTAGRSLHFRRIGEGPPVVLLHESPRSSIALMPLAERLAPRFTALALDTPGYGLSDPLPLSRPSIDDFADAVAASLRAAGLVRVPVYGTHTGATIAAALAVRHPDLVTGLVLDGFPIFTRQERELHEAFYLPQFPPAWDGSHIAGLWSRVRDQYDFFPWYLRGDSARLSSRKPGLAHHRSVFHDLLRSGSFYTVAYSASFRFDPVETLAALKVPFQIIARGADVLRDHLERLPPLPKGCSASPAPANSDAWAAGVADLLAAIPGQETPPPIPTRLGAAPQGALGMAGGRLMVRSFGDRSGVESASVVIHDIPGSAASSADVALRRAESGLVLVPELPGCGVSPALGAEEAAAPAFAGLIAQALDGLGVATADIEGLGRGTAVAAALAAALPGRLRLSGTAAAEAPLAVPRDEALPQRWDGADLLALWYRVRERVAAEPRGELLDGANLDHLHAVFVAECLSGGGDAGLLRRLA